MRRLLAAGVVALVAALVGADTAQAQPAFQRPITIQQAGVFVGSRINLNFVSGATCVDNATNNRVDCTMSGGGTITGSGTANQVAFWTSGTNLSATTAGTTGDCLHFNSGSPPTWSSCTATSAYSTVQEEDVSLTQRTILNFRGSAITAVDDGAGTRTNVTLSQLPLGSTSVVGTGRVIATTTPLTGGGDLTADRTFGLAGLTTVGTADQFPSTNAGATAWEYKTISGTASEVDVTPGVGTLAIGIVNPLIVGKGGTGADLSGTGGAANYVKQTGVGAAFTVGTIPVADIVLPGGGTTQVQFNNAGVFGGDADFIFNGTQVTLQAWDKGGGCFNPKAYGALGNDTGDDSVPIQAALDAADTAGGGTVCLPVGTYRLQATLLVGDNTTLAGAGSGTILKRDMTASSNPSFFGSPPYSGCATFLGNASCILAGNPVACCSGLGTGSCSCRGYPATGCDSEISVLRNKKKDCANTGITLRDFVVDDQLVTSMSCSSTSCTGGPGTVAVGFILAGVRDLLVDHLILKNMPQDAIFAKNGGDRTTISHTTIDGHNMLWGNGGGINSEMHTTSLLPGTTNFSDNYILSRGPNFCNADLSTACAADGDCTACPGGGTCTALPTGCITAGNPVSCCTGATTGDGLNFCAGACSVCAGGTRSGHPCGGTCNSAASTCATTSAVTAILIPLVDTGSQPPQTIVSRNRIELTDRHNGITLTGANGAIIANNRIAAFDSGTALAKLFQGIALNAVAGKPLLDVLVEGNEIIGGNVADDNRAILVSGANVSSRVTVRGNLIHDKQVNATTIFSPVTVRGVDHAIVEGNMIQTVANGAGLEIGDSGDTASDVQVRNNEIADVTGTNQACLRLRAATRINVSGNTLRNCARAIEQIGTVPATALGTNRFVTPITTFFQTPNADVVWDDPALLRTLVQLPSIADGSQLYCSDCLSGTSPCATGSPAGAAAVRVNGAWHCAWGTLPDPLNAKNFASRVVFGSTDSASSTSPTGLWMFGGHSKNQLYGINTLSNVSITSTGSISLSNPTLAFSGTENGGQSSFTIVTAATDTVGVEATTTSGLLPTQIFSSGFSWFASAQFRQNGAFLSFPQTITIEARYQNSDAASCDTVACPYVTIASETGNTQPFWQKLVVFSPSIGAGAHIFAVRWTFTNWTATGQNFLLSLGLHHRSETPLPGYLRRDGDSRSPMLAPIVWSDNLGLINHLTGPTDQDLFIKPGSSHHVVLPDNGAGATQLRLREPSGGGTNYSSFRAQTQAVDLAYILPAPTLAADTVGQVFAGASSSLPDVTLGWTTGGATGECLKKAASGVPTWATCAAASAYATVQEEGTGLTQRTILNFTDGPATALTAADDAGNTRTNVTLTVSPASGSSAVVGTARVLTTTSPLSIGGTIGGNANLSADRTVALAGLTTLGTADQFPSTNAGATAWEYKTISGVANETNVTPGVGTLTIGIVDPLIVGKGGTGVATLTDHGIVLSHGTSVFTQTGGGACTTDHVLKCVNSGNSDPAFAAVTGTGTVTSIAGGVGITNTPEPITTTGTVDLDINSLTTETAPVAGDLFAFVDVSVGTTPASQRKASLTNIEAALTLSNMIGPLSPAKGGTGINNGTNTLTVPLTGSAVVGTGTANQVTYWLNTNQVQGSADLTFDGDTFTHTGTITVASAAGATLRSHHIAPATVTVTGTTAITTATGFNLMEVRRPTYTDASAVTVDQGATLYVEHAPLAAGSLTLTNPYAVWVDNGTTRLDGDLLVNTPTGVSGAKAVVRDGNVYLDNTGTAAQLVLREPSASGPQVSSFRAQGQAVDLAYILPAPTLAADAVGQVLAAASASAPDVTLSWTSAGSTGECLKKAASGVPTWGGCASGSVTASTPGTPKQVAYFNASGTDITSSSLVQVDTATGLVLGGSGVGVLDLTVSRSAVGTVGLYVENTGTGQAFGQFVTQAAGDDPAFQFKVLTGSTWTFGVDNSDSDAFKLSASSALGTSDVLRFSGVGTTGDLLKANGSGVFVPFPRSVTAEFPLHENTGNTDLEYSVLKIGGGGTGLTTGTNGGIPYFTASTTAMSSSGVLGTNQIVYGGGAGAAPATEVGTAPNAFTWDPTNNRLGIRTTAPSAPVHVKDSLAGEMEVRIEHTGVLAGDDPILTLRTGGDTTNGNPFIRFDIVNGTAWTLGPDNATGGDGFKLNASSIFGTNPRLQISSVAPATGTFLRSQGTKFTESSMTIPDVATSGGVAYFSSTTAIASSGALLANEVVLGGGAATAPFTPSGTARNILFWDNVSNLGVGTVSPGAAIHATRSTAGTLETRIEHTGTASGDDPILTLKTGGATNGNPFVRFDITGGTGWTAGADNSASDAFKLNASTTFATNPRLQIETAAPTTGHYLRSNGTTFLDGTIATGDLPSSVVLASPSGTSTQIGYFTAGSTLTSPTGTSPNALTWDNSNSRLGVGTASPATEMNVSFAKLGDVVTRLQNTDTGASAATSLEIQVAGTAAADPAARFIVTAGSTWSVGADNSASDAFTVSASATLGTSDRLQLATAAPATGTFLRSNGTAFVGSGMTIPDTATSGGLAYFSSTTALSSSALLTDNALVVGGGAGTQPNTLAAGVGTTNQVLHAATGAEPTWSQVSLTADVTGTLPVANGGTGSAAALTSGGVLFASSTTVAQSSGLLTDNVLVVGGGAGTQPNTLATGVGTTNQVLKAVTGAEPAWGSVALATDVSGTLPIANGGTGQTTALAAFNGLSPLTTRGDLLTRDATNNIRLADVASGSYLRSGGVGLEPAWSTLTLPDTGVFQGDTFIATANDAMTRLSKNTTLTRYLANTGASNNPAWDQVNWPDGMKGGSTGGLPYYTSATAGAVLAAGTTTQVLHGAAAAPTWGNVLAADFASQTANTFLAAPNGSNGTPTFRTVATADLDTTAYTALLHAGLGGL